MRIKPPKIVNRDRGTTLVFFLYIWEKGRRKYLTTANYLNKEPPSGRLQHAYPFLDVKEANKIANSLGYHIRNGYCSPKEIFDRLL